MHRFMLVVMVLELFCPSGFAQNTSSPNARADVRVIQGRGSAGFTTEAF